MSGILAERRALEARQQAYLESAEKERLAEIEAAFVFFVVVRDTLFTQFTPYVNIIKCALVNFTKRRLRKQQYTAKKLKPPHA